MAEPRKAIFRTDASVMIGGGHVRRCLVLADALAEAGWAISFVCSAEAANIVPGLGSRGFAVMEPGALEKAPVRCDLVVVDDYRLDATFERGARGWAKRILVVDDLANRPHDCDVLLDQSPGRARGAYAGLVPENCTLLLGPSYALLDRRFRAARGQRRATGKVERIFVNFGTTDTANATSLALDAIAAADECIPTVASRPEARLMMHDVERALARLPAHQRTAIRLVGIEECSYEEAARLMDMTVAAVRCHLSRGRNRLREMVEGRTALPFRTRPLARGNA